MKLWLLGIRDGFFLGRLEGWEAILGRCLRHSWYFGDWCESEGRHHNYALIYAAMHVSHIIASRAQPSLPMCRMESSNLERTDCHKASSHLCESFGSHRGNVKRPGCPFVYWSEPELSRLLIGSPLFVL
jgi:hypothetical protein